MTILQTQCFDIIGVGNIGCILLERLQAAGVPKQTWRSTTPMVGGRQLWLETLGESIIVDDAQMNWCVGLASAAMSSLLPVLEGMTGAGLQPGFTGSEARRMAALMMQGTAALVFQNPEMDFAALKSFTPMATVDEVAVARVFHDAAQAAREKVDALATKIRHEH